MDGQSLYNGRTAFFHGDVRGKTFHCRCMYISRQDFFAIIIKTRRKGSLALEFQRNLHQNPTQESLTLEFCRHYQQNPTQGGSCVGILSPSSSNPNARGLSRWNFVAIIGKTRRKGGLALEFQRNLHQNPTQGGPYVGISPLSSAKPDARCLSRWNFIAIIIKTQRKRGLSPVISPNSTPSSCQGYPLVISTNSTPSSCQEDPFPSNQYKIHSIVMTGTSLF